MKAFTIDEKVNIRALFKRYENLGWEANEQFKRGPRDVLLSLNWIYGPRHFRRWTSRFESKRTRGETL